MKSREPTDQEIIEMLITCDDNRVRPADQLEPGPCDVRLQIAPMVCWRCGNLIKAVRGYITHRAFVSLAHVSDTRTVAAFVMELRKRDPKISPVSHRYSKTVKNRYFAAECPDCRALFGDFFMTNEFSRKKPRANSPAAATRTRTCSAASSSITDSH